MPVFEIYLNALCSVLFLQSNYYSACFDAYINSAGDEEMLHIGRPTDVCKTETSNLFVHWVK